MKNLSSKSPRFSEGSCLLAGQLAGAAPARRGAGTTKRMLPGRALGWVGLLVLLLVLLPGQGRAQYTMGNNVTTCSGAMYDSGGASYYGNNENLTTVMTPATPGAKLKLIFGGFSTEQYYDVLSIYDGSDVNAPLIGSYSGTNIPGNVQATNATGQLTLHFTSNANVNGSGFAAAIYCVTGVPLIDSFSPGSGAPGALVVVTVTNLAGFTGLSFNGTPATNVAVISATQLLATVPAGASTGPIRVSNANGTGTSATSFVVPPPTISSFTPTSGTVATSVVVSGTGFLGATGVSFNGTAAPGFSVNASGTAITVSVPAGASNGPIRVTTASGTAVSAGNFTTGNAAYLIGTANITTCSGVLYDSGGPARNYAFNEDLTTTLTPATAGAKVRVAFSQFDVQDRHSFLAIYDGADSNAPVLGRYTATTSPGTVTATNPTGQLTLRFIADGFDGLGFAATISCVSGLPVISGFSPTSGAAGTSVVLTGTGFLGTTAVSFNGTAAPGFVVNSASQITVSVPAGANSGPLRVTNAVGTGTSAASFDAGNPVLIIGTAAATTCAGSIFDSGGAGSSYGPNEDRTTTLTPATAGAKVRLTFTQFSLQNFRDFLYVYDGPNATNPLALIGQYSGTTSPGTLTATNPTGQLTLRFTSDAIEVAAGFAATISCVSGLPAISGFSPTSGAAGTSVVLTGTGFLGTTAVSFNGMAAPGFVVNSASQITVSVPAGASTGPISVTNAVGTGTSAASFDTGNPVYLIGTNLTVCEGVLYDTGGPSSNYSNDGFSRSTTITPASAGANVRLIFSQFSTYDSRDYVTIYNGGNRNPSTIIGRYSGGTSPGTVTAANPTGQLTVEFTSDGYNNAPGFAAAIYCVRTTVSSFTPTSGAAGTVVTITGINFTGASVVSFYGTVAPGFTVNAAGTQITVAVPAGAGTGPISVTSPAGTGTSAANFLTSTVLIGVAAVTTCGGTFYDSGGPGSSYGYNDDLTTTLTPATPGARMRLTFSQFSLDRSGIARLYVYDGADATAPLLGTFRGDPYSIPPDVLTATNAAGQLTLRFVASRTQNPGFAAAISCVDALAVSSFTPATGGAGTLVTIAGAALDDVRGVRFGAGGELALFTAQSPTSLTVRVPVGAASGPLTLTNNVGLAVSSATNFTYTLAPAGLVATLSPAGPLTACSPRTLTATAAVPAFGPGAGFDDAVLSLAVQADAKVLLGGNFSSYNGTTGLNRLVRLNPDGSRDAGFATGTGFDGSVWALAVQADGKVLVGGGFGTYRGAPAGKLLRLNADGSRDATFVTGTGFDGTVYTIAVQPDGRILLGGLFDGYNGTTRLRGLVRLNADGTIDASFTNPYVNGGVYSLALQADGRVLVGGNFGNGTYSSGLHGLVRLLANGQFDRSFPTGSGITATGYGGYVWKLLVQADGQVLVGGGFDTYNGTAAGQLLRLNPDGSRDTGFATGTGFNSAVLGLAVQADGKVLAGGSFGTYNTTTPAKYVARLLANGSFDTGFATGTGFDASVQTLALQADGRVLVGGGFAAYNGTTGLNRLARLNPNGSAHNTPTPVSGASFSFAPGSTGINPLLTSTAGSYSVVASFNGETSAASNTVVLTACPAPTISSFTPTSGTVGTSLSLTGTNLYGTTAITFAGSGGNVVTTGFTVVSATSITGIVVPAGAATGKLTVTTASGTSAPSPTNFLVLATPVTPPTLALLSTTAELPGQTVVLTGTGFTGASTVSIGGAAASFTYTSPTRLTAVVPLAALPGPCAVQVSTAGLSTSGSPAFEVLQVYRNTAPSGCLPTASTTVTGSGGSGTWRYKRLAGAGGAVVAAIEDTYNLGTVTAGFTALGTGTPTPVRRDVRSHAYLDRNFYLTATNQTFAGQTVHVRFFGLKTELDRLSAADAAATLATLKASQYSGANENCDLADNAPAGEKRLLPAPATVLTGTDWFTSELSVADHFSEFYLTGSSAPLPVELTSFTAEKRGTTVALAWATASEKNSDRFEVERSRDGRAFARIGQVAAAGSSSTARSYELLDGQLPAGATQLYYRLRQVDLDGSFSYSPVRAVTLKAASGLALYPNPATTGATLTGAQPGTAVKVYDALGRLVTSATADAAGTAMLALPAGLPAGVYLVRAGTQALRLTVE